MAKLSSINRVVLRNSIQLRFKMSQRSGYPAQIISINSESDGSGQIYKLDAETLQTLLVKDEVVKNRLIVPISIAGAMRTGKSFLLDFFLRYLYAEYKHHDVTNWMGNEDSSLKGFTWQGGMERVTSGIQIWSQLFLYDAPNGDEMAILLMDTQGIFDHESTAKDNTIIFAISTMLSSRLIYNISRNLQENDLQHLQMFSEYGKIALKQTGMTPFQNLTFLIRDWGSPSDAPFGAEGGKIIIEKKIMPNKAKQKKEVFETREHIVSCFEKINCYLMMNPGLEVTENEDFDGKLKDIRPKFIEQLKHFVPYILAPENLIPKTINGRKIKAGELFNYFISYMEFFNSKEMPTPESIFNATAKANNLTAESAGYEYYCSNFLAIKGMIHKIEDLDKMHATFKNQAVEKFNAEEKMGSTEFIGTYRKMLQKKCDDLYNPLREKACEKLKDGPFDANFIVQFLMLILKGLEAASEAVSNTIDKFKNKIDNITDIFRKLDIFLIK